MFELPMKNPRIKSLLHFSLRTMLVVLTVLCVLLAWKVRQVERQKEAIAWVMQQGSADDFRSSSRRIDTELTGPKWVRDFIGADYFTTVVQV